MNVLILNFDRKYLLPNQLRKIVISDPSLKRENKFFVKQKSIVSEQIWRVKKANIWNRDYFEKRDRQTKTAAQR